MVSTGGNAGWSPFRRGVGSRRDFLRRAWGLGVGLSGSPRVGFGEEDGPTRECFRRMGLIYEAIRRWQRAHGARRWPADLARLREEGFLTDLQAWICPLSESTQDLSFDPNNARVLSSSTYNRESNYNYEFSAKQVPAEQLGNLPAMDQGAWKAALAGTALGARVPVLRCKAHGPRVLNVGVDGRTYLSGLYWEYSFSHLRPEPYTMPWMVVRHPGRPGETEGDRPTTLAPGCLDLDPVANANPDLPWIDGSPSGCTLRGLLLATRWGATLRPIAFDARRIIQTTGGTVERWSDFEQGLGFLGQAYPRASRELALGRGPSRRLFVLHATAFRAEPGKRVGEFVVTQPGKPPLIVPLVYGETTGGWRWPDEGGTARVAWRGPAGPTPLASPDFPRLATAPGRAPPEGETCGEAVLYLTEFRLPALEREVGEPTLQLRADPGCAASPFVLGATLTD